MTNTRTVKKKKPVRKKSPQRDILDYDESKLLRRQSKMRNLKDFFVQSIRYIQPWFVSITEEYKRDGTAPMCPIVMLPSFYEDKRDKEIAAYIGMILPLDAGMDRVQAFRDLMGESPSRWFQNQDFMRLMAGSIQEERTGGVKNWQIAELMNRLYEKCHGGTSFQMCEVVENVIMKKFHCLYDTAFDYLTDRCALGDDYQYKIRLLMLVLFTFDGIGQGVWSVAPGGLRCPVNEDVKAFLKTFFPSYRQAGDIDDVIRLFGFERESDLWYTALAYKCKKHQFYAECLHMEKLCTKWQREGIRVAHREWDTLLEPLGVVRVIRKRGRPRKDGR